MIDPITAGLSGTVAYEFVKFWLPMLAAAFGVFKVINWVKGKLIHISSTITEVKSDLNVNLNDIKNETKAQTSALVGEIKELRGDFRTFYVPTMLHQAHLMQAAPQTALVEPIERAVRAKRNAKDAKNAKDKAEVPVNKLPRTKASKEIKGIKNKKAIDKA